MLLRDIEPGKLHDLRSASVNNTRLAIITAWHRLHPFLRYFSTRLFGEIAQFVASVKDARKGNLPPQLRSSAHASRMEQVRLIMKCWHALLCQQSRGQGAAIA